MLNDASLAHTFWAEAVNNACYTLNRAILRSRMEKTPYELWKGRKPRIGYFKVFGSPCYIYNDKDHLAKFDAKSDKGIFLGYADDSKACRVYNKVSKTLMITANVTIDDASVSNVSVPNISVEQASKDLMYPDADENCKGD